MPNWHSRRDADEFRCMFDHAIRIVTGDACWAFDRKIDRHVQTYSGREWFAKQVSKWPLHPAVYKAMELNRPDDWQRLLLEWPHRATTDVNRIAYTESESKAEADRQTLTTIGKYLRRHFSSLSDHMIRDIAALFTIDGVITYTNDMAQMVHAVLNGPSSCMSKDFSIRCADGKRRHPYEAYDPQYGWGMVIRREGDDILGRCLVLDSDDGKCFVRSYKRSATESYHSGVDEAIEAWLLNAGYTKRGSWPDGTQLACHTTDSDDLLLPYVDGCCQSVIYHEAGEVPLRIHRNGDVDANNTCGYASLASAECSCCGGRCSEDDGIWVGYHGEEFVGSCCSDDYCDAYGRNGRNYYVHSDNVVCVNETYYDIDYIDDNNIVRTYDGDFEHTDDVVFIESVSEYYLLDDPRIVYAEDTERDELRDECWICAASGKVYTCNTESVCIDGEHYHPDNAPNPAQEELFNEENGNA